MISNGRETRHQRQQQVNGSRKSAAANGDNWIFDAASLRWKLRSCFRIWLRFEISTALCERTRTSEQYKMITTTTINFPFDILYFSYGPSEKAKAAATTANIHSEFTAYKNARARTPSHTAAVALWNINMWHFYKTFLFGSAEIVEPILLNMNTHEHSLSIIFRIIRCVVVVSAPFHMHAFLLLVQWIDMCVFFIFHRC